MADEININEIIEANPQVDREKLAEGERMLRKLRELGTRGPGYRLAPPGGRRRLTAGDEASKDPRAFQLRHKSK